MQQMPCVTAPLHRREKGPLLGPAETETEPDGRFWRRGAKGPSPVAVKEKSSAETFFLEYFWNAISIG